MGHQVIPDGTRVGSASGRGVVVQRCKRAAADIRSAAEESERDMHPYAVRMDRSGNVLAFRGHELDIIEGSA